MVTKKLHLIAALLVLWSGPALADVELDANGDGKVDDILIPSTITRDSELASGLAGKVDRAGVTEGNRVTITGSGTVADPYVYNADRQMVAQETAPADPTLLWIDTSEAPTVKYHNGTGWTAIASGAGTYTLPAATTTTLGGIIVGDRLSVDANGRLSADVQSGTGAVDSVNTQTGVVVLDADDIDDASTTRKWTTTAQQTAWNAKLDALPTWLPPTGPTADNQIIQATGAGASQWTSVVDGLINDAGTGTDDLLSASEIAIRIADATATKQDELGFIPEAAVMKGVAYGYASLDADGMVPASQLPPSTGTDDQTAAEVGVSVANFDGNLSSADDTVQKALDTLDDMTGGGTVDLTAPGPIGSVTPNTAAFTTLVANSFDFGDPAIGETGEIGLAEDPANGANMVTLKAPSALAADLVFILPSAYAAAANHALVDNGYGVLSTAPVLFPTDIGTTVQGYNTNLADLADGSLTGGKVGSGITAANITVGTLPDARLSPLVPKWVATAPATATTTCTAGNAAYDATYIYVCVATNTWVRAPLATW
jgi:hypothetical protein